MESLKKKISFKSLKALLSIEFTTFEFENYFQTFGFRNSVCTFNLFICQRTYVLLTSFKSTIKIRIQTLKKKKTKLKTMDNLKNLINI
jgi:hypothetical protein